MNERAASILETIFNHSIKTDNKPLAWKALWRARGSSYRDWDRQFFGEAPDYIKSAKSVSVDELNEFSSSPYYSKKKVKTFYTPD